MIKLRLIPLLGCFISLGYFKKAEELLDTVPALIDQRKLGATKFLPIEVFIQKKRQPRV
jgi:hypothetical protein